MRVFFFIILFLVSCEMVHEPATFHTVGSQYIDTIIDDVDSIYYRVDVVMKNAEIVIGRISHLQEHTDKIIKEKERLEAENKILAEHVEILTHNQEYLMSEIQMIYELRPTMHSSHIELEVIEEQITKDTILPLDTIKYDTLRPTYYYDK